MADVEIDDNLEQPKRLHFEWILPLFIKPRTTLQKITEKEHAVWLVPLLVLTVLAIIFAVVASPIRQQQAAMGAELPADFQYYSPEQQQQVLDSQQSASSALFTFVFPVAGAVLGIWAVWFLFSGLLHLLLTLVGGRTSNTAALNLVSWASLPFAIRYVVQIVGVLVSQKLIQQSGFSALVPAGATGVMAFISAFLSLVDIYLIWQLVLLFIGVVPMTGISPVKARAITLVTMLIMLVLQTLPGYVLSMLGGGSSATPIFF
ncbi:MAG: hypothetical protein HGA53_08585 [Anaerolineaceae bacterium]|nr:hypothetical protein [Anaerolineaceae bacterium]